MNRQTLTRWLLVGLLLAMLLVPVVAGVAHVGNAGLAAGNQSHSITVLAKAVPAAGIHCTPPSSGNGCGGG